MVTIRLDYATQAKGRTSNHSVPSAHILTMASSAFMSPPHKAPFSQPNGSNEKQDNTPPVNPFLDRGGTPIVRTNNSKSSSYGSPNAFSPRTPLTPAILPANALRNRKINKADAAPPKTSVYFGTGNDFGSANRTVHKVCR